MSARYLLVVVLFGTTHMTSVSSYNCLDIPDLPDNAVIVDIEDTDEGFYRVWLGCQPGFIIHGAGVLECLGYDWDSSLHTECRACKRGTYQGNAGFGAACFKCPEQALTERERSRSIQQCLCSEGTDYRRWSDGVCRECPPGYEDHNGHRVCYVVTDERLDTWVQSRDKCNDIGGYLLEVDNEEEEVHIRSLLQTVTAEDTNWWIGYNDRDSEGHYQWPHLGSSGDYTNWARGEPSHHTNEDCAVIANHRDYGWNDVVCGPVLFAYICERRRDY